MILIYLWYTIPWIPNKTLTIRNKICFGYPITKGKEKSSKKEALFSKNKHKKEKIGSKNGRKKVKKQKGNNIKVIYGTYNKLNRILIGLSSNCIIKLIGMLERKEKIETHIIFFK